jgi:hypothetical protein
MKSVEILRMTARKQEQENLMEFGDVIFLEGMAMGNFLVGTRIPITLIEDRQELVFGGLLSAAYESEEMFEWSAGILDDKLQANMRLRFCDDDPALFPTIPQFRETYLRRKGK